MLALTGIGVTLNGCTQVQELHELSRLRSPDQSVDAVLAEVLVDATVSTPYKVLLVAGGESLQDAGEVFRSDRGPPPTLRWDGSALQIVPGDDARIWHFQNFGVVRSGEHSLQIEVALPGEKALPPDM